MAKQTFVVFFVLFDLVLFFIDELAGSVVGVELFDRVGYGIAFLFGVGAHQLHVEVAHFFCLEGRGAADWTFVVFVLPIGDTDHAIDFFARAGTSQRSDTDIEADPTGELLKLFWIFDEFFGVSLRRLLLFHCSCLFIYYFFFSIII